MDDAADFAEVEAASRRWMQAWVDQDRDTLDSLLAPDYSLIIASMPTMRFCRSNWLDTAVGPYVCTHFDYHGIQMTRVAGDTIVMSAIGECDATIDGVDRSGPFFMTDVWKRGSVGWQVCQRYSSRPGDLDESARKMASEALR